MGFGFGYETAQDFYDSGVWNYFAAPEDEIDRYNVKTLVARSLIGLGVKLPHH
jgi:hypothetical protein